MTNGYQAYVDYHLKQIEANLESTWKLTIEYHMDQIEGNLKREQAKLLESAQAHFVESIQGQVSDLNSRVNGVLAEVTSSLAADKQSIQETVSNELSCVSALRRVVEEVQLSQAKSAAGQTDIRSQVTALRINMEEQAKSAVGQMTKMGTELSQLRRDVEDLPSKQPEGQLSQVSMEVHAQQVASLQKDMQAHAKSAAEQNWQLLSLKREVEDLQSPSAEGCLPQLTDLQTASQKDFEVRLSELRRDMGAAQQAIVELGSLDKSSGGPASASSQASIQAAEQRIRSELEMSRVQLRSEIVALAAQKEQSYHQAATMEAALLEIRHVQGRFREQLDLQEQSMGSLQVEIRSKTKDGASNLQMQTLENEISRLQNNIEAMRMPGTNENIELLMEAKMERMKSELRAEGMASSTSSVDMSRRFEDIHRKMLDSVACERDDQQARTDALQAMLAEELGRRGAEVMGLCSKIETDLKGQMLEHVSSTTSRMAELRDELRSEVSQRCLSAETRMKTVESIVGGELKRVATEIHNLPPPEARPDSSNVDTSLIESRLNLLEDEVKKCMMLMEPVYEMLKRQKIEKERENAKRSMSSVKEDLSGGDSRPGSMKMPIGSSLSEASTASQERGKNFNNFADGSAWLGHVKDLLSASEKNTLRVGNSSAASDHTENSRSVTNPSETNQVLPVGLKETLEGLVTAVNRTLGQKTPSSAGLADSESTEVYMPLDSLYSHREAYDQRQSSPVASANRRGGGMAGHPGLSPSGGRERLDIRLSPRAESMDAASMRLVPTKATAPNISVRSSSQDVQRQLSTKFPTQLNEQPPLMSGGSVVGMGGGSLRMSPGGPTKAPADVTNEIQARRGASPSKTTHKATSPSPSPPAQSASTGFPLPGSNANLPPSQRPASVSNDRNSVVMQAGSYGPGSPMSNARQASTQRQSSRANPATVYPKATSVITSSASARQASQEQPGIRPMPNNRVMMPTPSPKRPAS